ncbi:hypothetical protein N665_1796s0003 [Sinapis alba]|nr:hypothetical protein N665_1796s0003 [Sinapis alba]
MSKSLVLDPLNPLGMAYHSTTSRKSSSGTTYQTTSRKSSSGTTYQTTSRKSSGKSSRKSSRSVPSFCQTNKIWRIHIDDIYAPVNYKNSHWLGIWILIPKRHIVVWDIIVGCIRQAQLDHVMAPFVNMVRYFLVECAATIEEHCKYSLEPFMYEIANAPQCESGDYDLFALKYIECHALGFPFPGSLNPKNSKTIREKIAVDIFEEIPDAHQTKITDVDVNQDITTSRRLPPDDIQTTSRQLPDDFQMTSRRLQPDDFHQTTSKRLTDNIQTTSRSRPEDQFSQCGAV